MTKQKGVGQGIPDDSYSSKTSNDNNDFFG